MTKPGTLWTAMAGVVSLAVGGAARRGGAGGRAAATPRAEVEQGRRSGGPGRARGGGRGGGAPGGRGGAVVGPGARGGPLVRRRRRPGRVGMADARRGLPS